MSKYWARCYNNTVEILMKALQFPLEYYVGMFGTQNEWLIIFYVVMV